jgi:probable F420-dependent oxidoreductase
MLLSNEIGFFDVCKETKTMKFGVHGINIGHYGTGKVMADVAQAMEGAGFESLWVAEHVVLPDTGFRIPGRTPFLDPLVALTYLATASKTLKLGTGVIILPQHNPLVLAKAMASVDVLSEGRLLAGFGVGYLQPEFQALGASFEDRGARMDEYLEAMLAIWSQEKPEYHGRFASFADIQAYPRPLQQPSPPIVLGGSADLALRRTVKYAQGWLGWGLNLKRAQQLIERLRQLQQEVERPEQPGELEITVNFATEVKPEEVEQLAQLGVQRIVLSLPAADQRLHLSTSEHRDIALRFLEDASRTLLQKK